MSERFVEYSGNSAPFHVGIGLMLFNRGLSFITTKVFPDDNESRGLKINDEIALKNKLFRTIQRRYNARIHNNMLKYRDLSPNHLDKLRIVRYKFLKGFDDDDPSGEYKLYPNSFVCKCCGHYAINKPLNIFNPNKCLLCNKGEYEQISLLRFCKDCGIIDKFYYQCKKHGKDYIKLVRGDKDNLLTWKFKCDKCEKVELDIFKFKCKHNLSPNTEPIRDGETRFQPITIRESGIFSPQVVTHIDLPKTEQLEKVNIDKDLVMLGFYFDAFKNIEKIKSISDIYKSLKTYESLESMNYSMPPELKQDLDKIKSILTELEKLRQGVAEDTLNEFNELSILKGTAGQLNQPPKFIDYIKEHESEELLITEKIDHYNAILEEFGIEDITYLSNVKLINSLIGLIKGVNKFWDESSTPHFELFWQGLLDEIIRPYYKQVDRENESFYVYSYPFETESILIELKPENICSWLFKNKLISEEYKDKSKAKEFLLKLNKESNEKAYNSVYKLLHTLSHVLLKKIHLYTGIGIDSSGEKIFVNGGAILLYSNNNLNIGAFQYLFENKMFCEDSIFTDIKKHIRDCSFDPLCIEGKRDHGKQAKGGACFSCLYIPEFVCCNFNFNLDRDVFIGKGKRGIINSYWGLK
ncbi:MAG: hypothetical protein GY861_09365 [bacterium]|nr:hypothetical protein [bacterium]